MRYSLRTLAFAVALLGALLSLWLQYQRMTTCHIRWLTPGSPQAAALVPALIVEERLAGYQRVVYYPSHRQAKSLRQVIQRLRLNGYSLRDSQESLEIVANNTAVADALLQALQKADVAEPGLFVIRGRVIDQSGKPLAEARVDLFGSYVFVNHVQTRRDGTFIMALENGSSMPSTGTQYLRVRTADDTRRWNSPTFSLDPAIPEQDVILVVPQ